VPAWIPYTLLRLALFGGTFAVVYLLLVPYALPAMMVAVIAAVAAALVSLTVTYIFFPTLRNRVSEEFAAGRERSQAKADAATASADDERGVDERAEDGD
jgi:ABC-type bacteriocin/lantibiotic exporter with double-glycine peptidase domain